MTKRFQPEDFDAVVACIKKGEVIAFPTDTVYGLGVTYENEKALHALQVSKGRPDHKPIPTMVCSIEQISKIAYLDENALKIMQAFMPGAITMILKKRSSLPYYITNGFDTVGIRMPKDAFVLRLIEKSGKPMLVTSANLSGEETGVEDHQVLAQLDGRIDGIVMGKAQNGVASTVVDVSAGLPKILREGPITIEMIDDVLKK